MTRETSAEIDAAAADWAARIEHAPLDPDGQAAFDAWVAADTRRFGAYARAMAVVAHAKRAKALGSDFDAAQFQQRDGVVELAAPVRAVPSRRRFLWLGGAATAATVLATVGVSVRAGAQTYRTPRGEVRLVPLPDGSSMTLNTASEVEVAFDETRRAVRLIEGEVFFEVARDPVRPFIVTAGQTDVRAIGTSFVVRKLQAAPVEVTVRQGEVELVAPSSLSTKVAANMRAVAAAEVKAQKLPSTELARTLAWREGMLSFEDVQLRKAAQEFARYSDVQIRFADAAIASETVTGLYAANNPVGFAKAVASSLGLQADVTRNAIMLHR